MTQIIEALKWRYATKKFDTQQQLSSDKIAVLKEGFNLTATSFGLQPVKLLILSDKQIQEQLVKESMGQQQVVEASHLLIFCIEKKVNTAYVETYFDNVKRTRNTPEEVLKPFKRYLLDHFSTTTAAENDLWAAKQAYLAMGNLLTICALEEIDACPMEGFSPEGYNKVLDLEAQDLQAVLVMPVGYRAVDDQFSGFKKVRKEIADAVIEL